MLALCLMLSVTYYAQNYAGIIGWSLTLGRHAKKYIYGANHCTFLKFLFHILTIQQVIENDSGYYMSHHC